MIYPWQQSQWQQIQQLISAERLPHALLLYGNEGLGKLAFARHLANFVLCQQSGDNPLELNQACGQCTPCQLLSANTHPDMHFIEPTASGNSKSKNPVLNIRIDDIRSLCEKLNQTSQLNGYRVAILDQADKLTVSAANSLLKTLEEPGQNVLILMQTSRPNRLPVTIRSRCQMIRFAVPEEGEALNWLKSQQADSPDAALLQSLRHNFGSPLKVFSHLQAPEHSVLLGEAMMAKVSGKNTLDYAAELAKYGKMQTLEGMLSWTSDLMKITSGADQVVLVNEQYRNKLQALAQRVNQQRLYKFHDQLNFNLLHSAIAVNEQLLWENLLLSWDNL